MTVRRSHGGWNASWTDLISPGGPCFFLRGASFGSSLPAISLGSAVPNPSIDHIRTAIAARRRPFLILREGFERNILRLLIYNAWGQAVRGALQRLHHRRAGPVC
jgi:hypothetical protein